MSFSTGSVTRENLLLQVYLDLEEGEISGHENDWECNILVRQHVGRRNTLWQSLN